MSRLTWVLYLLGTALVVGSWLGLVPATLAWIGWVIATGIAVTSWSDWSQLRRRKQKSKEYASLFTPEEEARARREILGNDD
jgi:membrane protein implicated in regulation of membrane protease activity